MSQIFLSIINMSISASYIVLAILFLRIALKKAPKWITVALWGIVAVRLICPFFVESVLSLIPSTETVSPDIMTDRKPEVNTGIPIVDQAINPIINSSFTPDSATSATPLQRWIPIVAAVWLFGMIALLTYTIISYVRIRRKIGTSVLLCDNIYQSENVVSPFVFGLVRPKIYLPFNINEKDMVHVVAHERAHIRRKDHLWKSLGFLLVTLHWFNPLMWLGYVLLCRDIELACDEKVIKELDRAARADYSEALLTCSVNRRMIAVCPLAFGEVGVKERVKSIIDYKKPAFWIIITAVVACVVVAVCFLTNPPSNDGHNWKEPILSLREKYPEFFDLNAEDGLTVYVWQFSGSDYSCYLVSTAIDRLADMSFAFTKGASISEMRTILNTYGISKDKVEVRAVINPLSSFYYVIDDAYREKLQTIFWSTIPYGE